VDNALDRILTEFNPERRKSLMATVQQEYTRELPVMPLYLRADIVVLPTSLKNFRMTGHQFFSTLSVNEWEWAK
jgi:peptide/nickel transport system substrate-binding protein